MLGTRYETDLTKLRRLHHVQKTYTPRYQECGPVDGKLSCKSASFVHLFRWTLLSVQYIPAWLPTSYSRFPLRFSPSFCIFSIVGTLFGACFVTLTTLGPERGKLLHLPCLRFVVRIFLCHRRRILPPVPPVNLIRTLVDASSTEPSTLILSLRDLGAWLVLTITQHPIPATPATPRLRSRAHSRA
jgi:hypothetical protein